MTMTRTVTLVPNLGTVNIPTGITVEIQLTSALPLISTSISQIEARTSMTTIVAPEVDITVAPNLIWDQAYFDSTGEPRYYLVTEARNKVSGSSVQVYFDRKTLVMFCIPTLRWVDSLMAGKTIAISGYIIGLRIPSVVGTVNSGALPTENNISYYNTPPNPNIGSTTRVVSLPGLLPSGNEPDTSKLNKTYTSGAVGFSHVDNNQATLVDLGPLDVFYSNPSGDIHVYGLLQIGINRFTLEGARLAAGNAVRNVMFKLPF